VTTTQDNVPGSLRAAITTANNNNEDDTINLPAGTYILSGEPGEDLNISGDLDINTPHSITIIGEDAETTIIDGNETDRVLHILNGTVSISDVTFQNGKTRDGSQVGKDGGDGGGIYNSGKLSLTDCFILNNTTGVGGNCTYGIDGGSGGNGGGIYNKGTLTLKGCTVGDNTTGYGGHKNDYSWCQYGNGGSGGGIYNEGKQTLTNCTISNNITGDGGYDGTDNDWGGNGGDGGGIYNKGTQTISHCIVNFNSTGNGGFTVQNNFILRGGHGGGICNDSGITKISDSIISNNTAGNTWYANCGDGGGIYNSGTLTLSGSTVRDNNTTIGHSGGHGGYGGGIYNRNTLSMTACTVSYNQTASANPLASGDAGRGGGIFNMAALTLTNCTISNNITGNGRSHEWSPKGNGGDGGGICNSSQYATLDLINCTISNNICGHKGEDANELSRDGYGGGVYNVNGTVNIKNSIAANNQVFPGSKGPDCYGTLNSQGYNLFEKTNHCTITGVQTGNITGKDPMLQALSSNGGATKTHALLPGSPAIDAGSSPGISRDQRGVGRPIDIPGIDNVSDGSDIGAYEFDPPITISGKITYAGDGLAGVTLTFSNHGGTTTTGEEGNYSHTVLFGWSGTVTPSRTGCNFSPSSKSYTSVKTDKENQDFIAVATVPPLISLNRACLNFGADKAGRQTGAQHFLIANSGGGVLNWSIGNHAQWLKCTPASGTGPAVVTVSITPTALAPGNYIDTITVEDANAPNSPQSVNVTLIVYPYGSKHLPFGCFDTPINNSRVMSSIPVTGWILDNIGIEYVKIYRKALAGEDGGIVFIGNAVLVEGARPDIEVAYPDYPDNYKAGWGYMLLTNAFPNQGNGTFVIYAKAADIEGNIITLGTKTIKCDNANAVKPFGAIDTPAQGGIASGSRYVNFGWALTPLPNAIPTSGSTITVWVDGVPLGHPVYNRYRKDIAALFPGYNNSGGAGGYYYLDTTGYENGVHTIAWSVIDDAGNTDGIGSRYFTIQNPGDSATGRAQSALRTAHDLTGGIPGISKIPIDYPGSVRIIKGYNRHIEPEIIYPDDTGNITVEIKELQRVEIHLDSIEEKWQGYRAIDRQLRTLPIGAVFDRERNVFFWMPGPGFLGDHQFAFIKKSKTGEMTLRLINVRIGPQFE
ncbi:choice-of-anchor Q domain-containing protein, partial [Acidobacteriota bacterium]